MYYFYTQSKYGICCIFSFFFKVVARFRHSNFTARSCYASQSPKIGQQKSTLSLWFEMNTQGKAAFLLRSKRYLSYEETPKIMWLNPTSFLLYIMSDSLGNHSYVFPLYRSSSGTIIIFRSKWHERHSSFFNSSPV